MHRLFKPAEIGVHGFLPATDPDTQLPENINSDQIEFNCEINAIIKELPLLLKEQRLRERIETLDQKYNKEERIIIEKHNVSQKETAILFLTMLAQAYIFENENAKNNEIPAVISRSLYYFAKKDQRRPMLTYNDYILRNWRRLNSEQPLSLDNIEPIVTFTETTDEAWFIKIHVAIEAECIRAINAAKKICELTKCIQPDEVNVKKAFDICLANDLREMTDSLTNATSLMREMKSGCDPEVFWTVFRPFLMGWNSVKNNNGTKSGVRLRGVNLENELYSYYGPSGAQSSILPAIDAVLNIKHEINSMFEHLSHFKEYMPREHELFILELMQSKTRRYIKESNNEDLCACYDEALSALIKFRGAHIGIVQKYIYQEAKKEGHDIKSIEGTGGSTADYYLSGRLKTTREQKIKI